MAQIDALSLEDSRAEFFQFLNAIWTQGSIEPVLLIFFLPRERFHDLLEFMTGIASHDHKVNGCLIEVLQPPTFRCLLLAFRPHLFSIPQRRLRQFMQQAERVFYRREDYCY